MHQGKRVFVKQVDNNLRWYRLALKNRTKITTKNRLLHLTSAASVRKNGRGKASPCCFDDKILSLYAPWKKINYQVVTQKGLHRHKTGTPGRQTPPLLPWLVNARRGTHRSSLDLEVGLSTITHMASKWCLVESEGARKFMSTDSHSFTLN